jgi:phosphatidylserine/phosphatidylglycerophosphate/cardiolipin synthase-like enzyme
MARPLDLRMARVCILLALCASIAFRAFGGQEATGAAAAAAERSGAVTLELVQTVPVETELGLAGLRDAHVVWIELLDGAREHVELEQFYAVDAETPTRLTPVISALERAAQRGVNVRFLADAGFHATYPELLDRLGALENVTVRLIDLKPLTGGVCHAKWMLVDGREGFLGSQNFDWRSLEHIQELGVRFTGAALVETFAELFERDWRYADDPGAPLSWKSAEALSRARAFPLATADGGRVTPVMSPAGRIVSADLWDLPRILALIDGAGRDVALQLLSYKPKDGAETWTALDDALRRAAGRGVKVRLLLSHWATRASALPPLRALHAVAGVEVRFLTVPEHSQGFLPFARVAHAKLLAVDGGAAGWIGTSNGSGDYFRASRNVGLIVAGGETPKELARYFDVGWGSPFSVKLDLARDYPEPRVAE